jgi:glucokinase
MSRSQPIPVLEIGGTHVTATVVDPTTWTVLPDVSVRASIDAAGASASLISAFAAAANRMLPGHGDEWAVAIPGPFEYSSGIGRFDGVGKFETLFGVDLRHELLNQIVPRPASISFVNDAEAFGVGEHAVGAARGHDRAVFATLGTGVGSAYLDRGQPLTDGPGVPPDGSAHLIMHNGLPLEDTFSRRAIRSAYSDATGINLATTPDVHEIAERSRHGDLIGADVLQKAFTGLGAALADSLSKFEATILVVGGSMAASWDIVEPNLRRGLIGARSSLASLPVVQAERPTDGPLVGAARWLHDSDGMTAPTHS